MHIITPKGSFIHLLDTKRRFEPAAHGSILFSPMSCVNSYKSGFALSHYTFEALFLNHQASLGVNVT